MKRAQPRHTESARGGAALTVMWFGVIFGLGGTVALDTEFLTRRVQTISFGFAWTWDTGHSLIWLAYHDPVWAAAAAVVVAVPLWFLWWRRSGMAFGRLLGVGLALGAAVVVVLATCGPDVSGGAYPLLVLTTCAFAAAFAIAPPPRDREAINDLILRGLLRRHRKSF